MLEILSKSIWLTSIYSYKYIASHLSKLLLVFHDLLQQKWPQKENLAPSPNPTLLCGRLLVRNHDHLQWKYLVMVIIISFLSINLTLNKASFQVDLQKHFVQWIKGPMEDSAIHENPGKDYYSGFYISYIQWDPYSWTSRWVSTIGS